MNNLDAKYQWLDSLCRHFSQSEGIPVTLMDNEKVISTHPPFTVGVSTKQNFLTEFATFNEKNHISIAETTGHLLLGGIWAEPLLTACVIVGPVKTYKASDDDYIRLLPDVNNLCKEEAKVLNSYIHGSPIMSYRQLYNKLKFLSFIINGVEQESLAEYSGHTSSFSEAVKEKQETEGYRSREFGVLHNNYRYERELLRSITLGDRDRLKRAMKEGTLYLFQPKYSSDEMRTLKDNFIVTATLISRAAISGGLDVETSLQLCDNYIITVEQCESMERVHNLQTTMVSDYIARTSNLSLPKETPSLIIDCVNYISANLTKQITTQSIANHFGKRREYLSTQFKQYTGYPISEFIMRQRVENAKALLQYTDISLAEISFHLCFSEQSHFQRIFKKYTGITPNTYRKKT